MKRILFVTTDFPPRHGGVASYYSNIIHGLDPHDVFVLTTENIASDHFDEKQSYVIYRKNFFFKYIWPKWLFLFWHVARIVRRNRIQCICVGEILPTGIVAYFIAKIFRIPYIIFIHGLDIRLCKTNLRRYKTVYPILRSARWIISNSNFTAHELRTWKVPTGKIRILTPGIDIQKFSSKLEDPIHLKNIHHLHDKKVLLSVGRLVERKGFDRVISALPDICRHIKNTVYVIVGSGPYEKELKRLVQEQHVEDHVLFAGDVDDFALAQWYAASDAFILLARELPNGDVEGFGIVYLEANYFGKPVIASKSGGVKESVIEGKTGYFVDAESSEQIARAVCRIFENPIESKKMGEHGRNRVLEDFQWIQRTRILRECIDN